MGMPTYGQGFTLANPAVNGLNAPASGPSQAGEFTRAAGFLAYYEVYIARMVSEISFIRLIFYLIF